MTTPSTLDAPRADRRRTAVIVGTAVATSVLLYLTALVHGAATDVSWARDRCKAAAMDVDAARAANEPGFEPGVVGGSADVRREWTPLPTWFCDVTWEDGRSDTVPLGRRWNWS